jgi:hypothetical protein
MASLDPALEVPMTATPVTMPVVMAAIDAAAPGWTELESNYAVALLWVESGGGLQIYQHNWGNQFAAGYVNGVESTSYTGRYWRPPWYAMPPEARYASLNEKMLAGQAPSAFRAYASDAAGLAAFVSLLSSARYAPLKAPADADDPAAYAQALHDTGYSKDYNSTTHGPTFRALVDQIKALRGGGSSAVVQTSGGDSTAGVVVGVALLLTALGVGGIMWARGNR